MTQKKAQLMFPPASGRLGAVKAGTGISIGVDGTICATGGGGGGVFSADAGNNIWSCNTSITPDGAANNFLVGLCAGANLTGAYNYNNTFIGKYAGFCSGTGGYVHNNFFAGERAGEKLSGGTNNNFIGYRAGGNGSYGCYNNFIGACAGQNEAGAYNNYFGKFAGKGIEVTGRIGDWIIDSSTVIPVAETTYYFVEVSTTGGTYIYGTLVRDPFSTVLPGVLLGPTNSVLLSAGGPITDGETIAIPGNQIGGSSPADDATITLYAGTGENVNESSIAIGNYAASENSGDSYSNIAIGNRAGQYTGWDGEFNHIFIGTEAGQMAFGGFYNIYIGAGAGQCAGGEGSFSNTFIGTVAGSTAANSFYQTFVGAYSGQDVVNPQGWTGPGNQLFGAFSGTALTTGVANSMFGSYAGYCATTGTYNSFFGVSAGEGFTTGSYNAIFGSYSGTTSYYDGGCAGNPAGQRSSTGSNNTNIGSLSGTFQPGESSGNVAVGYKSNTGTLYGLCALSVVPSTTVPSGAYCSYVISTDCVSTAFLAVGGITYQGLIKVFRDGAGTVCDVSVIDPGLRQNNRTFTCIPGTLIGGTSADDLPIASRTLFSSNDTCNFNNTFIGPYAGQMTAQGTRNFFGGFRAGGWSGAYSCDNVAIGSYAGFCMGGGYNIAIGCCAGALSGGYFNVAVGWEAGCCTSGFASVSIGGKAGAVNTADQSVFVGWAAGQYNTTGLFNTFVGTYSGRGNTLGCENTFVGLNSGRTNTTGFQNTFLGTGSGYSNTTGSENTAVGDGAGFSLTTGNKNTFIGRYAGISHQTGCSNVFVGDGAGDGNQSGSYNIFLGKCAGSLGLSSSRNISIGCEAGFSTTTGCNNNFTGQRTGRSNTTGSYNNYTGFCTGFSNTTGSYNNFTGFWTGRCNTSGQYNNFYGSISGERNTTGCYNTSVGHLAGQFNTVGNRNSFFGHLAGQCVTGSFNASVGNGALRDSTGCFNLALGHFAGGGSRPGCCNIYVGYYSGPIPGGQTGANNTYIGYRAGCATALNSTSENNILIGCLAGGDAVLNLTTQSNQIVLGNNSHTNAFIKVGWTVTSDERDKTCVTSVRHGLDFLDQITPVQYKWKNRETDEVTDETPRYGFLAQDILAAEGDPAILVDTQDPDNLKLRESMMIPVLVQAIKELHAEVKALKQQLQP